jgi:hypothetical protein
MEDDRFDVGPSLNTPEALQILDKKKCVSIVILQTQLETLEFNLID